MLNAFEAAVKARPIIAQLILVDSDHAWERLHEQFSAPDDEVRPVALVVARWVLSRLAPPRHHKGLASIVSVLAVISRDEELRELWYSPQLSQVIAELTAP